MRSQAAKRPQGVPRAVLLCAVVALATVLAVALASFTGLHALRGDVGASPVAHFKGSDEFTSSSPLNAYQRSKHSRQLLEDEALDPEGLQEENSDEEWEEDEWTEDDEDFPEENFDDEEDWEEENFDEDNFDGDEDMPEENFDDEEEWEEEDWPEDDDYIPDEEKFDEEGTEEGYPGGSLPPGYDDWTAEDWANWAAHVNDEWDEEDWDNWVSDCLIRSVLLADWPID